MPPTVTLTPETLVAIVGVLLVVGFRYIPGLNTRYAALTKETQQLVMLGLTTFAALVVWGLGCAGVLILIGLACSGNGLISLFWIWVAAVVPNQGLAQILPYPATVRAVKAQQLFLPTPPVAPDPAIDPTAGADNPARAV